jgi:hypothetical protein
MTLGSLVLCQHCLPDCSTPGSVAFFTSRVGSVLSGITLAALVSSLVAPWYASSLALETMADAYAAAVTLPVAAYKKL